MSMNLQKLWVNINQWHYHNSLQGFPPQWKVSASKMWKTLQICQQERLDRGGSHHAAAANQMHVLATPSYLAFLRGRNAISWALAATTRSRRMCQYHCKGLPCSTSPNSQGQTMICNNIDIDEDEDLKSVRKSNNEVIRIKARVIILHLLCMDFTIHLF